MSLRVTRCAPFSPQNLMNVWLPFASSNSLDYSPCQGSCQSSGGPNHFLTQGSKKKKISVPGCILGPAMGTEVCPSSAPSPSDHQRRTLMERDNLAWEPAFLAYPQAQKGSFCARDLHRAGFSLLARSLCSGHPLWLIREM